jgi:hypothetical protein
MEQVAELVVPLVAILVIFGLPLSYMIVNRVFAHQERIEMIRRGIAPPPDKNWTKQAAKQGWCDPSMYAQPPSGYNAYGYAEWQANRALHKGLTLACIGFALLVGLSFIAPGRPGPWLLGGLIPMFVGIAQIIIALMSGARLGSFGFTPPSGPGPGLSQPPPAQEYQQPPPPFQGARDVPTGPYAWRPGPTTELEKPPSPPDTR